MTDELFIVPESDPRLVEQIEKLQRRVAELELAFTDGLAPPRGAAVTLPDPRIR